MDKAKEETALENEFIDSMVRFYQVISNVGENIGVPLMEEDTIITWWKKFVLCLDEKELDDFYQINKSGLLFFKEIGEITFNRIQELNKKNNVAHLA